MICGLYPEWYTNIYKYTYTLALRAAYNFQNGAHRIHTEEWYTNIHEQTHTHTHRHYAPLIRLNMARIEYTLNDVRFVSRVVH